MVVGCSTFPWKTLILSGLSKHSEEAAPPLPEFVNLVTMLRKLGTYFKSKEEALYQYLFRCLDHVSRFANDGIGHNFGLVTQ